MTAPSFVLDACSILNLLRLMRGRASDLLRGGWTISLIYYEIGNALWRECFLIRRISREEASKLLRSVFEILQTMDVIILEDEDLGDAILNAACELGTTYYDAAYLTISQKYKKILVTDDKKLSELAKRIGLKTLKSRDIAEIRTIK